MSAFAGQRVRVTGTMAPTTAAGTVTTAQPGAAPLPPEFRVQSVQPIAGSCQP
jgi:hypothetical protein